MLLGSRKSSSAGPSPRTPQLVLQRWKLGPEVLLRLLESLHHACADGDGVDQDDELAQAIGLGELQRGGDVDVCLAGAGLHLDREVREVARLALKVI